jgi:hypothetical protein
MRNARWLELESPLSLALVASSAPWKDEDDCLATHTAHPVSWQRQAVPAANEATLLHEIVWCPRLHDEAVAIHRFSPSGDGVEAMSEITQNVLACSLAELDKGTAGSGSNVGGHHGQRDLWDRPLMRQSGLPALVDSAVERAANAEAAHAKRHPIKSNAGELWTNVLGAPGSWNVLHTHPGSTYSGCVFAADGGCCKQHGASLDLAGRLAFFPTAPLTLADHHKPHVVHAADVATDPAGGCSHATTPERARFLVLDPIPGTCIVFPSFVPHFVFPLPADRQITSGMRVSVAFNYSEVGSTGHETAPEG